MCHARYDGCCRIVVDKNSNFVNRPTDRQTNGQANVKTGTYVTKSGGQGDVSCSLMVV